MLRLLEGLAGNLKAMIFRLPGTIRQTVLALVCLKRYVEAVPISRCSVSNWRIRINAFYITDPFQAPIQWPDRWVKRFRRYCTYCLRLHVPCRWGENFHPKR